ncbi:LuxR C-terminal-related transcriptional regulator [Streptomyces sp. NPDC002669]|uniref:helix-turn-helix transcriptional regulator n=1 Tax=Streptomyces sp. NPDC002669 TaxID=3364658 RepID=UPI0036BAC83A
MLEESSSGNNECLDSVGLPAGSGSSAPGACPSDTPDEERVHHTVRPSASGRGAAAPSQRTSVALFSKDPLSLSGIQALLRPRPEINLLHKKELQQAQVAVVVAHTIDDDVLVTLRRIQRSSRSCIVLVAENVNRMQLAKVTECGVTGLVMRSEVTPEHVVNIIETVAHGGGHLPSDLLGDLLGEIGRLQLQGLRPNGIPSNSLTDREIRVLRMCAEGHSTAEIVDKLNYSERTVKYILHALMERLQLRNRSHAVAYAIRMGFF